MEEDIKPPQRNRPSLVSAKADVRRIEQGRRLRHKRVKGGAYLTQKGMALKAGVDVVSLSKMEHGEQPIPAQVWRAYGLEPEQ